MPVIILSTDDVLTWFIYFFSLQYRKLVAHCSVFCRFCPLTPTHTSVSREAPCLSLGERVSACFCLCHFSYSVSVCVCVCVCVCYSCMPELCSPLKLTVSWCTRVSHTKDQHTGVSMDSEQQLFIRRDPGSFRAVTPCYQTAWLSSTVDWKAQCVVFALAYGGATHVPDCRDANFRELCIQ